MYVGRLLVSPAGLLGSLICLTRPRSSTRYSVIRFSGLAVGEPQRALIVPVAGVARVPVNVAVAVLLPLRAIVTDLSIVLSVSVAVFTSSMERVTALVAVSNWARVMK